MLLKGTGSFTYIKLESHEADLFIYFLLDTKDIFNFVLIFFEVVQPLAFLLLLCSF